MQYMSLHSIKSVKLRPIRTSTIDMTGEFFHREVVVEHTDGVLIITLFAESSPGQLQVTEDTATLETLL